MAFVLWGWGSPDHSTQPAWPDVQCLTRGSSAEDQQCWGGRNLHSLEWNKSQLAPVLSPSSLHWAFEGLELACDIRQGALPASWERSNCKFLATVAANGANTISEAFPGGSHLEPSGSAQIDVSGQGRYHEPFYRHTGEDKPICSTPGMRIGGKKVQEGEKGQEKYKYEYLGH